MRVHQVNGTDGLDTALEFAQRIDSILDCRIHRQGQKLCGHAAGGGFFSVLQELDDFLLGLGLHLNQNLFAAVVRQVSEEIGSRVRIHFFDDVCRTTGVQRLDDGLLHPGLDLFQGLGGSFLIQSLKHSLPLIGRQLLHDVSDIGRMQLGEAVMRNVELYPARGIGLDDVHKSPGDGARRNFSQQRQQRAFGSNSTQQAADGAAGTDVHGVNAQYRLR